MKLALEALKSISEMVDYEGNGFKLEYEIKALEEALEQEQGEPVAWVDATGFIYKIKPEPVWPEVQPLKPLYTTPQQRTWVELTKDEIQDLLDIVDHYNYPQDLIVYTQAKLKEKNT